MIRRDARVARRNRLLLTAALLVLVLLVLQIVRETTSHDPVAYRFPSGPVPAGPVRFVAFGDSLAYGTCATIPHGFLGIVARELTAARPGSTFADLARPGATAAGVRATIASGPPQADAVALVAGANDVFGLTWPPELVDDFRATLAAIRARYPEARVVVFGVPDISRRPVRIAPAVAPGYSLLTRVDDGIERRAALDHGATFYDFFALSLTPAATDPRNLCSDGIHPNDAGYTALAAAALPTFRRAFGF